MRDRYHLERVEGEETIVGDKRQYLPYYLDWKCPDCGTTNTCDLRGGGRHGTYLSYPKWGEETTIPLLCNECDHIEPVVELSVIPNITLEMADVNHMEEP